MRNAMTISGPFFQNPTDILPPQNAPAPAVPGRLRCEYCECQLTSHGEIIRFSEKAKGFRDHEDQIVKRDKRIAELEAECAEHKQKIAAMTPAERARFDLDL